MDKKPELEGLTPERIEAGAEYLASLKSFGLVPDCLLWASDMNEGGWFLLLATRYFDAVGPLHIAETLFKAYRASVTPKQIDPFIVQIHSTRHRLVRELLKSDFSKPMPSPSPGSDVMMSMAGLIFQRRGLYRLTEPKLNDNLAKKWSVIEHMVDKLAA